MITLCVYLDDYDWLLKMYYAVDGYYVDEIIRELEIVGCDDYTLDDVENLLLNNAYNVGFTYSDPVLRVSVIVIGLTDSAAEFANTYDHEKGHAAMHIALEDHIDPYSEKFQYLLGTISRETFPIAKQFLCEHCREKLIMNFYNYGKVKFKFKNKEG